MADSTTNIPQLSDSESSPERRINALFDAASGAMLYGRDDSNCTGRVWGYLGGPGPYGDVANGTLGPLTASTTQYVVAAKSGGAVSVASTTTNWDDTTNYGRVAQLTLGTATITAYDDHRFRPGGILTFGAGDIAALTHAATSKATPVDADELPLADSAASYGLKKLTWANLKATVKTYLDTLYFGLTNLDTDGTLAANSDTVVATQRATKTYVDAKVAGLSWKQAVRAATTTAGTLATSFENGDVIDGVTLATGDRILVKNQSTASENGIYVVAASGAPARATDADSGAELVNASVYVSEGTANADTQWTCTTNAPITVGSTALAFAQLTSGTTFTGGTLSSALNEAPAATLASASTVNIFAAAANTVNITGTTTITAFDTIADGAVRRVVFGGSLTLTHNATSLILPAGANITTAAGDTATFLSLGSGNTRCVQYQRADGTALVGSSRSPSIQSVTSASTVTPTFSDDLVKITAQAAALTLANPTGTAIPGIGMVIRIKDNGTARAISYGTQYRAIGITLPTTTVVSKTTYLALIYNSDDTKWDVVATGTEA